jgi:hypothetical protein
MVRRQRYVVWILVASVFFLGAAANVWGARVVDKPESHSAGWQWLHGREAVADLDSCYECHDWFSCQTCHFADWPHEEGWQAEHGAEAARLEGRGCYLCHRTTYCDPCHGGVRMPHPATFLAEHPKSGYDEASCDICHVRSECDACHQAHSTHRSGGLVVR